MKIVRDPKPEERFVINHRPVNADKRYPRINFIGLGMSELSLGQEGETVLRGHVDRLIDGSILWTNVSSSHSFIRRAPLRPVDQVSAPNLGNWLYVLAPPTVTTIPISGE